MNIQSALTEGLNILKNKSILSAKLDIEILMAKALGKNREYIILNNDKLDTPTPRGSKRINVLNL